MKLVVSRGKALTRILRTDEEPLGKHRIGIFIDTHLDGTCTMSSPLDPLPMELLPCVIVIMGVSGSGKSTIASALANRLQWPFQEGDDLHSPANHAKMQSGTPLTDADRLPWLQKIAEWIDTHPYGVVTCSALKRSYRELIVGERKNVRLVYLQAERQLLEGRMGRRKGHFMPASLLDSQLATLEEPGADEGAVVVRVDDGPVEQTVDEIVRKLKEPAVPCS